MLIIGCIHRQLIWQNPVNVVLQDMGQSLSGGSLVETVCDKLIETCLLDSNSHVQQFPVKTGNQCSHLCAVSFDA